MTNALRITGNRTSRDVLREIAERMKQNPPGSGDDKTPPPPQDPPTTASLDDYLRLENISCVDADGNEFEKYDTLYVPKDVVRNDDGSHTSFTPYQGIVHFERQEMFLPSSALSSNILVALYNNRSDAAVEKVLQQYKDHGAGWGWHAQNTVVDWKGKNIVHYPAVNDFPEHGGSDNVNQGRTKTELSFIVTDFGDVLLETALDRPEFKKYTQNLTGLADPSVLVEVGTYFGKPAKVWVPNNPNDATRTAAAWLGCNGSNFDLSAYGNLSYDYAARGVQLDQPGGRARK